MARALIGGCAAVVASLAWAQAAPDDAGHVPPDAAAGTSIVILENSHIVTSASGEGAVAETHVGSLSVRADGDDARDVHVVIEGGQQPSDVRRCPWGVGAGDVVNVDWSGCNLAGANLSSRRFVNVDLHDANLEGADMSHAVLVNVDLRGAHLKGAVLDGVSLVNSRLDAAKPAAEQVAPAD